MKNFHYYDFFKLAKQLFYDANYQNEAGARTVIGRSYYSAFLHAREFIKNNLEKLDPDLHQEFKQYILPKGIVHTCVRKIIKTLDLKLGYKLGNLSDLRINADYKLSLTIEKQKAEEAIQLTEELISQINTQLATFFKRKIKKIKSIMQSELQKVKKI